MEIIHEDRMCNIFDLCHRILGLINDLIYSISRFLSVEYLCESAESVSNSNGNYSWRSNVQHIRSLPIQCEHELMI